MKKSRFTEEQIVFALKQAELGTPVPEGVPERELVYVQGGCPVQNRGLAHTL